MGTRICKGCGGPLCYYCGGCISEGECVCRAVSSGNDIERQLDLTSEELMANRVELERLRQINEQLADVCRRFIEVTPWNGGRIDPAELYAARSRALAVLASIEIPWQGEPIQQIENSIGNSGL